MVMATFRLWRGDRAAGRFEDYQTDVTEGMVVLDAGAPDPGRTGPRTSPCRWNCKAGKCGSCSAEVNGSPKAHVHDPLQRHPAGQAGDHRADEGIPAHQGPRHRRVLEFPGQESRLKPFKPRQPDADDGTWRMAQADIDRVQEFRKCIECFLCQDVCHVLRGA